MSEYYKHDHIHCSNQETSPCGIQGVHRCCLCGEPVPEDLEWAIPHTTRPHNIAKIVERAAGIRKRFEARFCGEKMSEHGILQIGIVDPWKSEILDFIADELIAADNIDSSILSE